MPYDFDSSYHIAAFLLWNCSEGPEGYRSGTYCEVHDGLVESESEGLLRSERMEV
jgi:hypothetical protein